MIKFSIQEAVVAGYRDNEILELVEQGYIDPDLNRLDEGIVS